MGAADRKACSAAKGIVAAIKAALSRVMSNCLPGEIRPVAENAAARASREKTQGFDRQPRNRGVPFDKDVARPRLQRDSARERTAPNRSMRRDRRQPPKETSAENPSVPPRGWRVLGRTPAPGTP